MAHFKRSWLISLAILGTCLVAGGGTAQQEQPVDLWQFPQLANSKPFQRWWWAFQQRAHPLSEIPKNATLNALQEIELSKASLSLAPQQVQGDTWVNIGPAPILGGQTSPPSPVSGRIESVSVDPSNANHWLIGAAQGGIWETHDAGTTWTPKTDSQASLATGAIAFAPSDPNVIYAGTGEAGFSIDAYAGQGLLKSTDGGTTWQLLATATFAQTTFSDIKVHPTNPDLVLAATAYGGAGRGVVSPPAVPALGIFKSTDGGVNWAQKLNGVATDLEADPGNFNNQYAGIGNVFGSFNNGVYRSTDAGETWALISGPWSGLSTCDGPVLRGDCGQQVRGVGRVELAIAPSNPNVLYVSIQDAFNGVGNDGGLLGLWRTDNAWAPTPTWTQITIAPNYCGSQCWYNHEITVDPTDANILYAGGTPLWKFDGTTWTDITNGIHVDQHSMAWVGNRLIVGNDGGVWSTIDGGDTWTNHNTTLSITQFYDGSIHPTDPNFALAGSQDNGTEQWTGTDAWQWIFAGDGAANAISSSHPDTHWAVSFQGLGIARTTNGSAPFTVADAGIDKTGAPFIARIEKCPANDDVFIAGTDNLWKSTDFFSAASPSWSSNGPEMGNSITALAFAASDATCFTYAFGTGFGLLRLTSNGGSTWVDIDVGNAVPNRYVTDLVFDPANANVLYVTLSGFDEGTPGQPGHVFKTTNALAASPIWSNVSPLVNIPHNTIVLDPSDPHIIYVGTDLGVWKSTDAGSTWTHLGPETGMPNVAVFDLQINHITNMVVAFTHGRGAFKLSSRTINICGDGLVTSNEQCDDGNATDGDGCSSTCAIEAGFSCSGNPSVCSPICGDGLVKGTEQCDLGANWPTRSCCSATTCQLLPADTVCRSDFGATCDVAETCDGVNPTCPANGFRPAGTVCRPARGVCDAEETCTGTSPFCPANNLQAAGTACPDDGKVCTLDQCDGTHATCQHPAGHAGTVCRPSSGAACDVAETCDGVNSTCPANGFRPAGTVCRAAVGACDAAEFCTGTSPFCPANTLKANSVVCRPTVGACDVAETCTGTSAYCPANTYKANSVVCRPAAGACDVAETCTGTSAYCPANSSQPAGTLCRTTACSVAGTCTGTSPSCPANGFEPVGTVCRPAVGACDVAETCTGTSPTCPANGFQPNGTFCNDGSDATCNDHCAAGACVGDCCSTSAGQFACGVPPGPVQARPIEGEP